MPPKPKKKPSRKAGARTTKAPGEPNAPLTPLQQVFHDKLKACTQMERKFVIYKLQRKTGKEAAILAGYAPKNADVQAAQLLGRLRVAEAIEAGLRAGGFGPLEVLDDIAALRTFDRSQIEREIKVRSVVTVERRAEEVIQELITRERAVETFMEGLQKSDEQTTAMLQGRLRELLRQRLELEEQVALDSDATTLVDVEQLVTKRVIDYDLARERGLLRFIKGERPTKFGPVIELHDWVTGLEMAAKAAGVFIERHEHTGRDGGPIQTEATVNFDDLSGEQIAQMYTEMLGQADGQ